MNIYWITKINKTRFYSTSRYELAKALRERGHHVTLITERKIGEQPHIDDNEIRVPSVPSRIISRFFFGLLILFYAPFIIRKQKIDVVLLDGANIWSPFALSIKFFRIPIILDIRTISTDKEQSLETLYYDTSLVLSKFIVNGLTTITPELRDVLVKKYHINKKNIGVWTTGVSKELLNKPVEREKKNTITIEPDCMYLMYHGTYEITRGIENLIESIAELKDPLKKKIRLMIVGIDKIKTKELLALINNVGLHEKITLIPPVDHHDMYCYLDACDVGVIPLAPKYIWWQTCAPIKTLEYLSRGKPIIATNIPFHQRIFDKGTCGLLLPSSDKQTLADAITKIYAEKDSLTEMGAVGRDIVKKYYTWDHSAADLEEFITKIIAMK